MNVKLTLRLEDSLIQRAKQESLRRGKSVSQMVSDYFNSLNVIETVKTPSLPPLTASLVGILKGSRLTKDAHRKHLSQKHQ